MTCGNWGKLNGINYKYVTGCRGDMRVCRNPLWAGRKLLPPYTWRAEGIHERKVVVQEWAILKEPWLRAPTAWSDLLGKEGAEENKYPDLILLIHSAQAKHPPRGSAGEKVGKCVWWGILKIFWAQQALKITKTISKGDRAVQMWRVKALWRAAARRKRKERSSWRSLHVRDLALRLQPALAWWNFVTVSWVKEVCN